MPTGTAMVNVSASATDASKKCTRCRRKNREDDKLHALNVATDAPAQAGQANDVRLPTAWRSRPCLQPDGYTISSGSSVCKFPNGGNPIKHERGQNQQHNQPQTCH